MIKSYKSFLIRENLNNLQFLLEGYLEYSDEFKQKLAQIEKKSGVAKTLLNQCDKEFADKDLKNNFVDITTSDDKVSFISQSRINTLSVNYHATHGFVIDPYDVKGRTEISIGRCVRALYTLIGKELKDKDLEDFVNLYKSIAESGDEEFKLISGDEIKNWYKGKNMLQDYYSGSLLNSCMVDCPSSYFNIYSNSPSCQMLILTKKDYDGKPKLIGRALVWKPSEIRTKRAKFTESEYFMDRIYTLRDSDEKKFIRYADEKGWLKRAYNNSAIEDGIFFFLGDDEHNLQITCQVEGNWKVYPYMDTLKFLNKDKNLVSNIGFAGGWVLESTDGDTYTCDECNGSGKLEVSCNYCDGVGSIDCEKCDGLTTIDCSSCDGNGEVDCPECGGNGITCSDCEGEGLVDCDWCDGTGKTERRGKKVECVHCEGKKKKRCKSCKGKGITECENCDDSGVVECPKCSGNGSEKCPECDPPGSGTQECPECHGKKDFEPCRHCVGLIENL